MEAVGKLIAMNVEHMQAARDESVPTPEETRIWLVVGATSGLVCAFGILGWIALCQIARPLASMTREMAKLANGDLDIQVEGCDRADEIGGLARSLQVFKENAMTARRLEEEQRQEQVRKAARQRTVDEHIEAFDEQVGEALDTLTAASTEMNATAGSMAATAEETSRQSAAVAESSEQASSNVQTVAAAAEQLHASVEEISRQVTQSAKFASTAVVEADRTNATIQGLADTGQKIGEGGAVIQNFSTQTAKAAKDISTRTAGIQAETGNAVEAIKAIGGTIRRMNEVASAIASAVEEQGAATRNISHNIQLVSQGTNGAAANIVGVSQAAEETGTAAAQGLTAADDLSRQADMLRANVNGFFARIRAA